MNVNESAENYLETILILSHRLPVVRSVDIANELGFKKSSVSIAMKNLREKKHIVVSDSGFITLTESGKAIADEIYERHQFLSAWLIKLGVDPEVATNDACKIEHVISHESFEAIKKIFNYNTDSERSALLFLSEFFYHISEKEAIYCPESIHLEVSYGFFHSRHLRRLFRHHRKKTAASVPDRRALSGADR